MLNVSLIYIALTPLIIVITSNYTKLNSPGPKKNKIDELSIFLLASLVSLFVIGIICYPKECYQAAVDGVNTWINIVLPALLPFFVGAELLIGLGVINLIGIMLEPIIRPLFKAPGSAAFVFVMSMFSGYPVGVKLTCDLRNNKMCTRAEAQRMLAFCSTSGPLFIMGAVAVGMFGNPSAGVIIAVSHYLSATALGILVGLLFSKGHYKKQIPLKGTCIRSAIKTMLDKRKLDPRPFGVLWGDAVKDSVNALLIIGGFIIIFSVIIQLFHTTGILYFLSMPIENFFGKRALPRGLIQPVLSGFLEITLGSRQISELKTLPFVYAVCSLSLIIGWSGLSIHAQALSFISKTDLNPFLYMLSKLFHGILGCLISYALCLIFLPGGYRNVFLPVYSIPRPYTFSQGLTFSIVAFFVVSLSTMAIGILQGTLGKLFLREK